MKNIIYGIITDYEEIKGKNSEYSERIYYGTHLNNFYNNTFNIIKFKVIPTSIFPINSLGSSFSNHPQIGSTFIGVMDDRDPSKVCYILSYIRPGIEGTQGELPPNRVPDGGYTLSLGGYNSMSVTHGPAEYIVKCNSFSEIRLDGNDEKLEINLKDFNLSFVGGYVSDTYFEKDDLHSHWEVYTKQASNIKDFSDVAKAYDTYNSEPEQNMIKTLEYDDKVVIRAGAIFNVSLEDKPLLNHVYQLETRQAVFNDKFKDCVSVLRLGYQKENNKYNKDTTYPEGSIIEWSAKLNNYSSKFYNTFLLRWGELLDNTTGSESEKTSGEFFRLQLYNKVNDRIGKLGLKPDMLGEGKGYSYKFLNEKAEGQFTLSIGKIEEEENSFFRLHTHNFEINNNKYSGTGVNYIIDNDSFYFKKEIIDFKDSEKEISLEQSFKKENTGTFLIKKSKKDGNSEKIEISKDLLEIEIKVDNENFYNLKFKEGKIKIDLNGKRHVEINKDGEIILNPGNEKKKNTIKLGINGFAHQLVTKEWIEMYFKNHVHPTTSPGSPTLPPTPMPVIEAPAQTSHLTYLTLAE